MKIRGSVVFLLASLGLVFLAFYPPVDNTEKEAVLMQTILSGINYFHYHPMELDDEFSEKVYDLYLDRLDGGRRWLTQEDINKLDAFKHQLDDSANGGTFEVLDIAIEVQEAGINKSQEYYRHWLASPFDFSKNESIEVDGDKKTFAENDAALKEFWRKWMKYETMTRLADKLKDKESGDEDLKDKSFEALEEESRAEVLKVYDDWYVRLNKRKRTDHLSNYLNSFTNILDPHSSYFEPIEKENFNITMSGQLKGIGARLQTDGDYTKVSDIIVGGPAWKGKELEKDDKITKVAQADGEPVDITGMVLDDVVKMIRGEPDTEVRLHVKKSDGTSRIITIIRDVVIIEESFAKSLIIETDQNEKIGYIRLPKFYGAYQTGEGRFCADDVETELGKLEAEGVSGVILDVRSNSGGYLWEVVKMSGLFVEEGPMVQVKSRDKKPKVLRDEDPQVQYSGPLVVMVNSYSASASEILAAALQDYDRAVIVGAGNSTFGKGTVQRFFNLDRYIQGHHNVKPLGEVKLTVQKYYRVNGGSVQLKGVTPDVILPDNSYFIDSGEKEHDYPLGWSEIPSVDFEQNVYSLDNLSKIRERSAYRIKTSETFQQILDAAKLRKEQRDDTEYPLSLEAYQTEEAELEAKSDEFRKALDKDVLKGVRNLTVDAKALETADESKVARNDDWVKNIKKDIYLEETLKVIHDLIHLK